MINFRKLFSSEPKKVLTVDDFYPLTPDWFYYKNKNEEIKIGDLWIKPGNYYEWEIMTFFKDSWLGDSVWLRGLAPTKQERGISIKILKQRYVKACD